MSERSVNGKIPSAVRLEVVPCPNGCSADSVIVLSGRDRLHNLPGEFSVVRCTECGLERTNPRPTPETISYYYPEDYAPYDDLGSVKFAPPTNFFARYAYRILDLESRRLPEVEAGRMLEFGCSSGDFMEYAKNLGWSVDGIEFSPEVAEKARKRGFNVKSGAIESASDPELKYDMVVGWMVVEHLHDPVGVLKKLRTWTNKGGLLVISTPDVNSISRRIFGDKSYDLQLPTHLYHFTAPTLTELLKNSGWEIKETRWVKNCNTLLWSLQYWADENKLKSISRLSKWLRSSSSAALIRLLLRVSLGFTRQSGRMVVVATPN